MEKGTEHKIQGTEENTKSYNFDRKSSILLYVEGTCCWEIYTRRKFMVGAGEEEEEQGEGGSRI